MMHQQGAMVHLLNDCLHAGPAFGQNIFDIILRFRLYKTALTRGIEKAFLMISIATKDKDSMRFLWINNITSRLPKIVMHVEIHTGCLRNNVKSISAQCDLVAAHEEI